MTWAGSTTTAIWTSRPPPPDAPMGVCREEAPVARTTKWTIRTVPGCPEYPRAAGAMSTAGLRIGLGGGAAAGLRGVARAAVPARDVGAGSGVCAVPEGRGGAPRPLPAQPPGAGGAPAGRVGSMSTEVCARDLRARLDEDQAATEAASPGPWHVDATASGAHLIRHRAHDLIASRTRQQHNSRTHMRHPMPGLPRSATAAAAALINGSIELPGHPGRAARPCAPGSLFSPRRKGH